MTHRPGAALDRRIVIRWRELAEQRLAHLADLHASGRWRRYYSEATFTADLRDAERAVAAWRYHASPAAVLTARSEATSLNAGSSAAEAGIGWRRVLPPVAFLASDPATSNSDPSVVSLA
jgi:uncharacterized repeat protein (TIGR03809 family)